MAKKSQKAERERSEDLFVALDAAFTRVVGELTEMRVRQRALLELLDSGSFAWERYIEVVRNVRSRDFDALFSAIVYRPEAFADRFKLWIEEDTKRYLYRTSLETDDANAPTSPGSRKAQRPTAPARKASAKRTSRKKTSHPKT